jgi:hypothetical protein
MDDSPLMGVLNGAAYLQEQFQPIGSARGNLCRSQYSRNGTPFTSSITK